MLAPRWFLSSALCWFAIQGMSLEQQRQNTGNADSTEYIGAVSDEFDPNNVNCTSEMVEIRSPEDLEAFKDKCKVYDGMLTIATNFSGHVNMDGLERVRYFSTDVCNSALTDIVINDGCNITGISSATLVSMSRIYVYHQRLLKSISFPRLENITDGGGLTLGNLTRLESVNLPRLEGGTSLSIFDTPKLTNLSLPEKGWTFHGVGDESTGDVPGFYISNVGLESLDALLAQPRDLKKIHISDVPNVKSLNIRHSSTERTDIHGHPELDVNLNVSGREFPWTKNLNVTGLAKLDIDGLRNVSSFDATDNTFKRLEVNFTAHSVYIAGNNNLTSLYLLKNKATTLVVDGINLNLSFPTGSSAQPDQETGFWAWPDPVEYIIDMKIGGYISEEFFAGLKERDKSELPTVGALYVNSTKPDFPCDTLDDIQWSNSWDYSCSPENEANNDDDDDDYDDTGSSAGPSAALLAFCVWFSLLMP